MSQTSIEPADTARPSGEASSPQPSRQPGAVLGAELLVRALEAEGVDVVFAYPGGNSLEIHHALARSPRIRTLLPRHEQGGIFAAEGYARATGRPGVCLATSGPGATNLVTGLADAFLDSIPLVAITGQVPTTLIGHSAFQEVDVVGMTRPITKAQLQVRDARQLGAAVHHAFALARAGRPGPVVIDVPKDVQQTTVETEPSAPLDEVAPWSAPPRGTVAEIEPEVTPDAVEALLERVARSRRPVLYVGGGVIAAGATAELRAFAERTRIPVTTTLMGLGAFPEEHPLSLRWLGMHGAAYANWAVDRCDLLIAVGARFDDRVTGRVDRFCPDAFVAHIDIDRGEIGKNKAVDLAIVADARTALAALLSRLDAHAPAPDLSAWHETIARWKAEAPFGSAPAPGRGGSAHLPAGLPSADVVTPQRLIERLFQLTGGEAILTTGVGQHQMWAAQFYRFKEPRQLITSGGLGTMGFGYPAAIGAKLARPDRLVIDIDGDGSFLMNLQELALARVEGIAAKAIVLDNQHLGMVVQLEDFGYGGAHAHSYLGDPAARARPYPDLPAIVRGFDVPCRTLVRNGQIDEHLRWLLAESGPAVLHVLTPHDARVLPYIKGGGCVGDMVLG